MKYLLLFLEGPMQAWGGHTYEDYRPVELFPTRSGLLGLLGACLGIERSDIKRLRQLSNSVYFAVRSDAKRERWQPQRLIDYHTVQNVRNVAGGTRKFSVETQRQYLCDAVFYLAVGQKEETVPISLETIAIAVNKPVFTPYLGRKSCPLTRPLFEGWAEAADAVQALRAQPGGERGCIYSEHGDGKLVLRLRDMPLYERQRQFATRTVYIYTGKEG